MNARLLVALALVVCAVVARAEEAEESSLANIETVEPAFLEADAVADASSEGFPFQLPKKLQRTTVEPRYYGESAVKPKKYTHPEYRDPAPVKLTRKQRKLKPVTFTSHYFSPLPKKVKGGKKLRASRNKKNRSLVPFRHTVETPAGHRQHKGFTQAELFDGRLPNKYDDPRQNMKKTKAPAPQISFVEFEAAVSEEGEVDTTEEMESEEAEGPVPPPFQHDEGEQVATIIQAEEFFDADHQVPTWADEEATESVLVEEEAEAEAGVDAAETIQQMTQVTIDQSKLPRLVPLAPTVSAHDALEQAEDLESFLESEQLATASFVEIADEAEESESEEATEEEEAADEAEEEAEDEAEDAAEDQDEAEDGVEDEAEEESDSEDEADAEEEVTEFAFVESAANTQEDSVDAEMDEMEQNELAASQVDMDAQSDEAAMTADEQADEAEEEVESETVEDMDADEDSSAEEADTTEEVIEEDEAVEDAENAVAVALVEEASDAEEVDTLLSEIDSHLNDEGEAQADTAAETEAEAEGETQKGTPGHAIAAGQTWEDAQNERLNAMAAQLEAEKAATPKVAAAVVASKAELHAIQAPEYDSAEAAVETVEPELLVETAAAPSSQAVLLEKIAKLKAIRRA